VGAPAPRKIALCIASGMVDMFGYLHRYAETFARVARQRGVEIEVLRYPEPDFYPRLLANMADKDCIVHFYGYLYDLKLPNTAGGPDINPMEFSHATIVTSIGDHPFSSFMHCTVANAHPRMKFIVMDSAFQGEMQAMNGTLRDAYYDHQPVPPPINFDENRPIAFKDRGLDLFVPMYIRDMTGSGIDSVLAHIDAAWFIKIVGATYETCSADPSLSPFPVFAAHFQQEVGLPVEYVCKHNNGIVASMMNAVTGVDGIIRQERRLKMVETLLANVGGLKVALTCDPFPSLKVDGNVTFIGMQKVGSVSALMANARAVLNCNPSYPTSLHERVVSGMFYGNCVISDVNVEIAQRFQTDELIAYAPESGLTLHDIYAATDIEGVARAGAAKVAADPAYSWDGHFDRLLQAAAA
jgi:hypothetical protein